jgi:hypothetical protein
VRILKFTDNAEAMEYKGFVEAFFRVKRSGFIFLTIIAIMAGLFLYSRSSGRPPAEEKVIANFSEHRRAYERLRDMLFADQQLVQVAKWGVETTKSIVPRVPPDGDFPSNRYKEYLAVLGEIGALRAYRAEGVRPESIGILVWASGWAGDTRHVEIIWSEPEPANQVSSLSDFYKTSKPRHPVFRKIEGHWYIWADW